jgi:hypothetical protein
MSIIDDAAFFLDSALDIMGAETVKLIPSGKVCRAIVSNDEYSEDMDARGTGYVGTETIIVHLPKSEGDLAPQGRLQARGKVWVVDELENDETAWNARCIRLT